MGLLLAGIGRFFASKVVLYLLLVVVLVGILLAYRLPTMLVEDAEARWQEAQESVEAVDSRTREMIQQISEQQARLQEAANKAAELKRQIDHLDGWWESVKDWFRVGERARQHQAERDKLAAELKSARAEAAGIRTEIARSQEEKDRILAERDSQQREVDRLRAAADEKRQSESDIRKMLRETLTTAAWKALWILLVLTLVPVLWKIVAYYVWAPLVEHARPVVVDGVGPGENPDFRPAHPAQRFELKKGDVMLAREKFLQSSTEDARRATKWLLDWRHPLTSLASGLFLVTRIAPDEDIEALHCEVTLSCQANATEELSVLGLAEGRSLVVRPRFLAAVVFPEDHVPRFRPRWIFNRLQAWITLQFRYLSVEGPCTLVFAGERGIQSEQVVSGVRGRRINRNLTVGYSPGLEFRSRRAETFLAYFRGANPLFDDFFSGTGWTYNQQVAGQAGSMAGRFWESLLQGIGKIFGL